MTEEWRQGYNTGSEFRKEVDKIVYGALGRENKKGLEKYGPDFVGDPMTHAIEELIGAVRYLATRVAELEVAARGHRPGHRPKL